MKLCSNFFFSISNHFPSSKFVPRNNLWPPRLLLQSMESKLFAALHLEPAMFPSRVLCKFWQRISTYKVNKRKNFSIRHGVLGSCSFLDEFGGNLAAWEWKFHFEAKQIGRRWGERNPVRFMDHRETVFVRAFCFFFRLLVSAPTRDPKATLETRGRSLLAEISDDDLQLPHWHWSKQSLRWQMFAEWSQPLALFLNRGSLRFSWDLLSL